MAKEGSSDYKKVRKRWFFKNLWLNGSLWNQKWFFYGIAVKNLLSTFIFKSVEWFFFLPFFQVMFFLWDFGFSYLILLGLFFNSYSHLECFLDWFQIMIEIPLGLGTSCYHTVGYMVRSLTLHFPIWIINHHIDRTIIDGETQTHIKWSRKWLFLVQKS